MNVQAKPDKAEEDIGAQENVARSCSLEADAFSVMNGRVCDLRVGTHCHLKPEGSLVGVLLRAIVDLYVIE